MTGGKGGDWACSRCAVALAVIPWLDAAVESPRPTVTNEQIAELLDQVADRLEAQRANIYRIDAYRAGAEVVRRHETSIQDLALTEGREGLDALPQIGSSLSGSIDEIAHTGRLRMRPWLWCPSPPGRTAVGFA